MPRGFSSAAIQMFVSTTSRILTAITRGSASRPREASFSSSGGDVSLNVVRT